MKGGKQHDGERLADDDRDVAEDEEQKQLKR